MIHSHFTCYQVEMLMSMKASTTEFEDDSLDALLGQTDEEDEEEQDDADDGEEE